MKNKCTKEELEQIVKNSFSIREVLLKIGLAGKGGNFAIMREKLKRMNVDTSHFKGQGWRRQGKYSTTKKKFDKIFKKDSRYSSGSPYQSSALKEIIFRNSLKEKKCERCNNTEWIGSPIPLELHHIDGDRFNNEISNLQVLCPNCHAQTDNYRGKNIK